MSFACIYVPNFSIAAVLRAEPELQNRPIAVFEGKPPLEKIIAVNEYAARLSIAPGMTKAQAELCSELVLRPRTPLQESSTHAAMLDCAQSFSPCVEDTACDTAIFDLSGMGSLFGSLPKISQAIADRASTLGLKANIAVAPNPDAALISARGFSGVTIVPAGKEAEQLGSLPTRVLFNDRLEGDEKDSADRLLETLDRWGIRSLRALAALPEVSLSERLGQQGLHLQKLARGAASRPLVPVEAPLIFEEAVELEHPIVLLEPLAFLLNRLLDQLCARLGSRALATQELRLTLELSNVTGIEDEFENIGIPSESDGNGKDKLKQVAPSLSRFVRQDGDFDSPSSNQYQRSKAHRQTNFVRKLSLPLPMLDAKVFLKLLQLDLNAHPPGAPIMKIHLSAEPARPRSAQGGLFLPPSPEPEKLELTLARIAGIVGEQRVGAVELLDTHHPEGFRMRRFVAEVARKAPQKKTPDAGEAQSAVTVLRRFRPPLRANVTLENGQPLRLHCSKKKEVQGEILWKAGPWRFSGDWWDRDAWSRDEWDLALRNEHAIAFYRLVHDLLGGGWFVEGTYD
ncbi:MAG TPA: DNA polymerase Y family protein [Candidatus Sulfotelmatobacter sp.]|nr:DNA polymerase Y family protein [Candidatus Sulfotelmatobacter sp.]